MPEPTLMIYTGPRPADSLSAASRVGWFLLAGACLAVLIVAARLTPNSAGVSTHTQLGMKECAFLARTGIPCPSCGMTSSFAWFVRGNLLASLYIQPMGTVLAALTAITFWASLYLAWSAKPPGRLLQSIPPRYYLPPVMAFAVIAWGWKIFIHLRGTDGWR